MLPRLFETGKKAIVADAELVVDVEYRTSDDLSDVRGEQFVCKRVAVPNDVLFVRRQDEQADIRPQQGVEYRLGKSGRFVGVAHRFEF